MGKGTITAILLAVMAMVVVTVWCAAMARVFGVQDKELAAWAQAIGSLVAVGAAIWAANHQTTKSRDLELERSAKAAAVDLGRARKAMVFVAERLKAAAQTGVKLLDEERMTKFTAGVLQSEYEAGKTMIMKLDAGIFPPEIVEQLFKLDVLASITTPAFAAYDPGRVSDRLALKKMLEDDIGDLGDIIAATGMTDD
jgi:hypothetical protein